MQGVLRTRRGLAAASAAVIACILLLLFATAPHWRPLLIKDAGVDAVPPSQSAAVLPPSPLPASQTPAPLKDAASAPDTTEASPPAAPTQKSSTTTAALEPASPAQTKPNPDEAPGPAAVVPSFDIVRIEPNGDSVIAARAAPNSEITLLDGDKAIAHATADANGEVALLPPPLKPGEHSLTLSVMTPGSGKALSSQTVVVSVPQLPKTAPMVAMIQPNAPATVLSGPVAGAVGTSGTPPSGAGTNEADDGVAIRSVEVESMGSFLAAGKAAPGSQSRVYLNGSYVATVTADKFGKWELQIKRGMKPGRYAVRVDQVESKTGKVTARAEVPFDYPRTVSSSRKRLAGSPEPSPKAAGAGKPGSDTVAPSTGVHVASAAPSPAPAGSYIAAQTGGTASGAATARTGVTSATQPDGSKRFGATVVVGTTAPAHVTVPAPVAAPSGTPAKSKGAKPGGEPDTAASAALSPDATATQPGKAPPGTIVQPEVAKSGGTSGPPRQAATPTAAAPAPSASAAGTGLAAPVSGSGATGSSETTTRMDSAKAGTSSPPGGVVPQSDVPAIVAGQAPTTGQKRMASAGTGDGTQAGTGQGTAPASGSGEVAGGGSMASAASDRVEPTIVPELVTATVFRGDSLWRISRKVLGHGIRYTQIYAANTKQIRDPNLIYPGQVFVVPQAGPL